MKKGDLVKVRRFKGAGIIQAVQTSREVSGPDGDFHVSRHYRVLLSGRIWRIHESGLILISSHDIS